MARRKSGWRNPGTTEDKETSFARCHCASFSSRERELRQWVEAIRGQQTAFHAILRRVHIYLDTIGFSGFKTAIQAIGCSLPIVTREGKFMRGRLASAILKRIGLAELVARTGAEYIDLAVRLASDVECRRRRTLRIAKEKAILFEDPLPIQALEAFFTRTLSPASGTEITTLP